MSGKMKQRSAVNTAESATVSVNEKILRECHSLYTEPDNGNYYFFSVLLQFVLFILKTYDFSDFCLDIIFGVSDVIKWQNRLSSL